MYMPCVVFSENNLGICSVLLTYTPIQRLKVFIYNVNNNVGALVTDDNGLTTIV